MDMLGVLRLEDSDLGSGISEGMSEELPLPPGFLGGEVIDLNDQSVAVGYGIDPQGGQGFRDTRALRWFRGTVVELEAPGWISSRPRY